MHLRVPHKSRYTGDARDMKAKLTNTLVGNLKPQGKPYEVRDESLKGLILRVQTTGVKTYYLEYQRGKRIKVGAADALVPALARDIAKGILAEHYKGEDPKEKRSKIQAETYEAFLDKHYRAYLVQTLRKSVNNQENVKETMATLKGRFSKFKKLSLDGITPVLINEWQQDRLKEGIKPASIKRQLNDLRACLNKAVKWGALGANPFDKVESLKLDSDPKVRHLSQEEERRLRIAIDERETAIRKARSNANQWREERGYELYADLSGTSFADHLKPAVIVSLNTGLRQGELFQLKWSDVNFDIKTLTVDGKTAKSGITRHIPLNDEALEVLKLWKAQPGVKSLWVFHGEDGKPFKNIRTSWTGVLKSAKIENFRWHDLRHTFASNLVMAGVDLNTVRELLGHSDYKMTQRYAHLAPEHKLEAVNRLTQKRKA